jgi:23S rRNA (guanosine2251-2'-O)-methyltransferase
LPLFHQLLIKTLKTLVPAIYESGETPLILVLDSVTDVRNMGAIARTAACAGVHAIVVPLKNAAQINADAIKTSAGALFNIPICRHANLHKTCLFLQDSGLQLIACTEKTNDLIYVPLIIQCQQQLSWGLKMKESLMSSFVLPITWPKSQWLV